MDTVPVHQLIDVMRRTLRVHGWKSCRISWAESANRFDLRTLFEFVEEAGFSPVELRSPRGRRSSPFNTFDVHRERDHTSVWRVDRQGQVFATGDAAVMVWSYVSHYDDLERVILFAGRSADAIERLVREFDAFSRERLPERREITVIGGDPIARAENLSWEDVCLPPSLRSDLRDQVEGFFAGRDAYRRMGVTHKRGLLLAGPPGNGKTTIVRVIASQRPEAFVLYTSRPEHERADVDQAFRVAVSHAPSVLCFEDVDSLFKHVPLSYFLNSLDGLEPLDGVLILATTNHPEELDEALVERPSRFDRIFEIGNPGPDERRSYLSQRAGVSDESLVEATDGFSLAQVKEVWVSACLEAISEGRSGPTLESMHRAVRRLRGQSGRVAHEWRDAALGFQQV